jgi:hypothetical protein
MASMDHESHVAVVVDGNFDYLDMASMDHESRVAVVVDSNNNNYNNHNYYLCARKV